VAGEQHLIEIIEKDNSKIATWGIVCDVEEKTYN
jgi:hypothetical protein